MDQFTLDYSSLQNKVNAKKAFKLSGIAPGALKKVAFDVVRFVDSQAIDGLWQIVEKEDGPYIMAMYDDEILPENSFSKSSHWKVYADTAGRYLSFFYQDTPIVRLASDQLGIAPEEAQETAQNLPGQLESNSVLRSAFLQEIPADQRLKFTSQFPELKV